MLEHKRERDRNGSQGDHGDQAAPVKRPRLGVNQEKRVGSGNQDQHVEGITGLSAVTKDEFSLPDSEQQESRIEFTAKDDDWLRLRTSRLLDLEDEKDEDSEATARRSEERRESGNVEVRVPHSTKASLPSDVGNAMAPEIITESLAPQTDDLCRTARLFLRNISYTATEDDIRAHFEAAVPGLIDEVGRPSLSLCTESLMNILIGTSDLSNDVIRHSIVVDTHITEACPSRDSAPIEYAEARANLLLGAFITRSQNAHE